jgi:hypothetical protein
MILTRAPHAAVAAALCTVAITGCATSGASTTTSPRAASTALAAETASGTGAQLPAPARAASCSDRNYVIRAFCYLSNAGVRNSMINADCGALLANDLRDPGHVCRTDIERYETFLRGAQRQLHLGDLSGVPVNVVEPASWLHRAVSDDLEAARMAVTAIRSHDYLGFLKAWGLHGEAGRALQTARDTFFSR